MVLSCDLPEGAVLRLWPLMNPSMTGNRLSERLKRTKTRIGPQISLRQATPKGQVFLRMLGEFEVFDSERKLDLPTSRKTRALLAYLGAVSGRHTRSKLCDLFFDRAEDPRAALRWSLSKLRQSLGERCQHLLLADREAVEFVRTSVRTDVEALSLHAKANIDLPNEALANLVRGEFLDGLDLPACYSFHAWCLAERGRTSAVFEEILRAQLARKSDQDAEAALFVARLLVSRNPFDEESHLTVIRLLMRLGRIDEAIGQHDLCAGMLARELGVQPSKDMRMLRQKLASKNRKPKAAPTKGHRIVQRGARRIIGRDGEVALVSNRVLKVIREGQNAVMLISGPPGIGKSRLLDEVESAFRNLTSQVLRVKCFEAESIRPLGLWSDLLGPDLFAPAPRDRAAVKADGSAGRARLFKDILDDLVRRLDTGPLALLIDDFQWADDASIALLSFLYRNLGDRALLFCLTARPGELEDNPAANAFLYAPETRPLRIALTALSDAAAQKLVHRLNSNLDAPGIVKTAGGNPLMLIELVRGGGLADGNAGLADLLAQRRTRISPDARELFNWASVFGKQVPPRELAAAFGTDVSVVLPLLAELERHDLLLTGAGGAYVMSHDLIRQAAYFAISHPRRCLMHARIARLLGQRMEADQSLAIDVLLHAGEGGEHALAAGAAVLAGQQALRAFANDEAENIARRGLLHAAELAKDAQLSAQSALLGVLVHAASGLNGASLEILMQDIDALALSAAAKDRADIVARASYLLSIVHQERGDIAASAAASLRAAKASEKAQAAQKLRQLANTARCLMELGRDVDRAENLIGEAAALATANGLDDVELYWARGLLLGWKGKTDAAITAVEIAVERAAGSNDRWREAKCRLWLCMLNFEAAKLAATQRHAQRLEAMAAKMGEGAMAPSARVFLAISAPGAAGFDGALQAALDDLVAADDKSYLVYALNMAARVLYQHERVEPAIKILASSIRIADEIQAYSEGIHARALLILCHKRLNQPLGNELEALKIALQSEQPLPARVRNIIKKALP